MRLVYSSRYHIDIGCHVFPTVKYGLVLDDLLSSGLLSAAASLEPQPADWRDLALVHTPDYLQKVRSGSFSVAELARLEIPWSPEVVEGFRLMAGGTLSAAAAALESKAAVHLGGGFHHAFPDHGEGFCLFNDVAVAVRAVQRDASIERVAVIDCDVHQGNGTAATFQGDPSVFTMSMHQLHNYPVEKPRGSLDIGLDDGTDDEHYLALLEDALPLVLGSRPGILFYLAGADPFREDRLGGLSLTLEGLRRRDRTVFCAARDAGIPVVVTLAGGYARQLEDTVRAHVGTVEEAIACYAWP